MATKAFLFDLDGVLADTEPLWEQQKQLIYTRMLGPDLTRQLGQTRGMSVAAIHQRVVELGTTVPLTDFEAAHQAVVPLIYDQAPLLDGADGLAAFLVGRGYVLGVVSSSVDDWVQRVVRRLPFKDRLQLVLSLQGSAVPPKPAPDGYRIAMERLGATPATTVILEDSNAGIESAVASGAFTITFDALLPPDYKQLKGSALAHTVEDVERIVTAHDV